MKPLIAWPPLSGDVDAALRRLEDASEFTGLRHDYEVVSSEATRRSLPAFFSMLPGMALFAVMYGGVLMLGWLRLPEFLAYLGWMLIIPFTAVVTNTLRGMQAVKDEMRIDSALRKWRRQAEKTT